MSRNSKNTRNRAHAVQFQMGGKGPSATIPKHGKVHRINVDSPSKVSVRLATLRKEKQGSSAVGYSC